MDTQSEQQEYLEQPALIRVPWRPFTVLEIDQSEFQGCKSRSHDPLDRGAGMAEDFPHVQTPRDLCPDAG
jgi:hypothetical protein